MGKFSFLVVTLALAPGCNSQGDSVSIDTSAPTYAWVTDSVAATAGFPSLSSEPLPSGVRRELRAYIGFGLAPLHYVYRIWEDQHGVHGWAGHWWQGVRVRYRSENPEADTVHAAWLADGWRQDAARLGCIDLRARPDYETCTLPTPQVDWHDILDTLDRLRIARLPPPRDRGGMDGITLVVEHRQGRRYRAYSYWTPSDSSSDRNERAAAAIMDVFRGIAEQLYERRPR